MKEILTLTDKDLNTLINKKIIKSSEKNLNKFIQPASLDIPLGKEGYILKQKFIPFQRDVKEIINKIAFKKINIEKETILYKHQTYLFPVMNISLPKNMFIKLSPKSSLGRIDVLVRGIFDNTGLYDYIPNGKKGQLWIEITPQSFNIIVKKGLPLNQLRVFIEGKKECSKNEQILYNLQGKKLNSNLLEEKPILSLSVDPNKIFGYEAISTNEPINLSKIKKLEWKKFFREIKAIKRKNKPIGKYVLEKDRFYILSTKEKIRVPEKYSIEMVPFTHLIGELRVHYAGFFDPGFGMSNKTGAQGVLEIRPHENISVYDGQPICLIEIYCNNNIPKTIYGNAKNNYQNQTGPRLAKYFKQ